MNDQARMAFAYHAAGHLAVAIHEGLSIDASARFTLFDVEDELSFDAPFHGLTDFPQSHETDRSELEKGVRLALAGPVAQGKGIPGSVRSWHYEHDIQCALGLLARMVDHEAEIDRELSSFFAQVQSLLDRDMLWRNVVSVAGALADLGSLSGKEVLDIVQQSGP